MRTLYYIMRLRWIYYHVRWLNYGEIFAYPQWNGSERGKVVNQYVTPTWVSLEAGLVFLIQYSRSAIYRYNIALPRVIAKIRTQPITRANPYNHATSFCPLPNKSIYYCTSWRCSDDRTCKLPSWTLKTRCKIRQPSVYLKMCILIGMRLQ